VRGHRERRLLELAPWILWGLVTVCIVAAVVIFWVGLENIAASES
jgi:hypothetical protein